MSSILSNLYSRFAYKNSLKATPTQVATTTLSSGGNIYLASRLLGSTSTFALTAASDMNLSINPGTGVISAVAPIANATSQLAVIREANNNTAVEYPVVFTGTPVPIAPVVTTPMTPVTNTRIAPVKTLYGNRPMIQYPDYYRISSFESGAPGVMPTITGYTHMTMTAGNWSDPTIWDAGTVPGANAVVMIMHDVKYDANSSVLVKDIMTMGNTTFTWDTSKDTLLWVDTMMIMGTLVMGQMGDPIAESTTLGQARARIKFWQSQAPGSSARLGLMTMGPVSILGAKKTHWLKTMTPMAVGVTVLTLPDIATSNWRVGDTILIGATENMTSVMTDPTFKGPSTYMIHGGWYGAKESTDIGFATSQDEPRQIVSINGTQVTIDKPLSFIHTVDTRTLPRGQVVNFPITVGNMSRSIEFSTAGDDPNDVAIWSGADLSNNQKRAHSMLMYTRSDVRYASFLSMGRTQTDATLVIPGGQIASFTDVLSLQDVNTGANLSDPNNVRGRYGLHFHGAGATRNQDMCVAQGVVVRGQLGPSMTAIPGPGWGITHHNSRVAIEDCVVYNQRGASIVSEFGNEIGQWVNNWAVWCRGDGISFNFHTRHDGCTNHNGHSGIGFENQSRAVRNTGNLATSCQYGWGYIMQDEGTWSSRVVDQYSHSLLNPLVGNTGLTDFVSLSGNGAMVVENVTFNSYGFKQTMIPLFNDNRCEASTVGFHRAHIEFINRLDNTPFVGTGFHCRHVKVAYNLINYTYQYTLRDSCFIGTGIGTNSTGAYMGNVEWGNNLVNLYIDNVDSGIVNSSGFNFQGYYCDIGFGTNVTKQGNDLLTYAIGTYQFNRTSIPTFNLTDPWTLVNGQINIKPFKVLKAADLPWPYPNAAGWLATEPSPGTAYPYFTLNPAASKTAPGYTAGIAVGGYVTDRIGVKVWPYVYSSESYTLANGYPSTLSQINAISDTQLLQRNGCYIDSSTGKTMSRLWFVDVDRWAGDYFLFHIDVDVTPASAALRTANMLSNPDACKPDITFPLEDITLTAFTKPAAPSIISPTVLTGGSGRPLRALLLSNCIGPSYVITGGADAAKFKIRTTRGMYWLDWVATPGQLWNNGAQTTFVVNIQPINAQGLTGPSVAHTVTLVKKTEGVNTGVFTQATTGTGTLDSVVDWQRYGDSQPGSLYFMNNAICLLSNSFNAVYTSNDTGSLNHYVTVNIATYSGPDYHRVVGYTPLVNRGVAVALCVTDQYNYIACWVDLGVFWVHTMINGTLTLVGTLTHSSLINSGDALRCEYIPDEKRVNFLVNGVLQGQVYLTTTPPPSTYAGLRAANIHDPNGKYITAFSSSGFTPPAPALPYFITPATVDQTKGLVGDTLYATYGKVGNGSVTGNAWLLNGNIVATNQMNYTTLTKGNYVFRVYLSGPKGDVVVDLPTIPVSVSTALTTVADNFNRSDAAASATALGSTSTGNVAWQVSGSMLPSLASKKALLNGTPGYLYLQTGLSYLSVDVIFDSLAGDNENWGVWVHLDPTTNSGVFADRNGHLLVYKNGVYIENTNTGYYSTNIAVHIRITVRNGQVNEYSVNADGSLTLRCSLYSTHITETGIVGFNYTTATANNLVKLTALTITGVDPTTVGVN